MSLPPGGSSFSTVRDEYGNNRTTWKQQLPEDAEPGDEMAYRVDFFRGGGVTLIQNDPNEWDPDWDHGD